MGRTAGFVTGKKKRFACGLLAAGVLAAITVLMPVAVFADEADTNSQTEAVSQAGGVVFSTDYPGITVKPGGASTFPLYITNTGSKETTVALEAEDLPKGWEGAFKNTSNEVSMVHVGAHQKKEDSPSLSYSLTVPEDAKEDTYTITLNAKGGSVNEELKLSVKVDAEEGYILVKGNVPGPRKGLVTIKTTVKPVKSVKVEELISYKGASVEEELEKVNEEINKELAEEAAEKAAAEAAKKKAASDARKGK